MIAGSHSVYYFMKFMKVRGHNNDSHLNLCISGSMWRLLCLEIYCHLIRMAPRLGWSCRAIALSCTCVVVVNAPD